MSSTGSALTWRTGNGSAGRDDLLRAGGRDRLLRDGRALSTSPRPVGKRVAALEGRFGVQLLVRTTRRHSITEAGQAYDRCRAVVRDAEDAVTEFGGAARGQLTISAPCTFGSARLMPFIAAYLARNGERGVKLVLTDRTMDIVGAFRRRGAGWRAWGRKPFARRASFRRRGARRFRRGLRAGSDAVPGGRGGGGRRRDTAGVDHAQPPSRAGAPGRWRPAVSRWQAAVRPGRRPASP